MLLKLSKNPKSEPLVSGLPEGYITMNTILDNFVRNYGKYLQNTQKSLYIGYT